MMRFQDLIESEYKSNPIPTSPQYNQELGNLDFMVAAIERHLNDILPDLKDINVRQLVDSGKLVATQDWLTDFGGGDPVFDELEEPVIFQYKGIGYIIDGHHRLASAYLKNQKAEVYWFK